MCWLPRTHTPVDIINALWMASFWMRFEKLEDIARGHRAPWWQRRLRLRLTKLSPITLSLLLGGKANPGVADSCPSREARTQAAPTRDEEVVARTLPT